MANKFYLGDSVYVESDSYGLWLTTWNGYPDDPRNKIYLEPEVYQALIEYVARLKEGGGQSARSLIGVVEGKDVREDKCKFCGAHVGWFFGDTGAAFALAICDECNENVCEPCQEDDHDSCEETQTNLPCLCEENSHHSWEDK